MIIAHKIAQKILLTIILPLFIVFGIFGLTFRIFSQAIDATDKNSEIQSYQKVLNERRMTELELQQLKIIMNMEDYRQALEKSNGGALEDGEERIVVN